MPMSNSDAQQIVQGVYDSIYLSLTGSPDGGKAAYDPNKTFITMEKPGSFINPADFANSWTPGNLNGSLATAADTWDLVNYIPNVASIQSDLGPTISETYQQILRATVTIVDKPDPALKKQYDDAYNLLHTKSVDENGNPSTVQSTLWANYDTNQAAWVNAQSAYQAAYMACMADPKTKSQWPVLAPALQLPVKQAFTKWRAEGGDQVEAALAVLSTSGTGQVQRAFADAQVQYSGYAKLVDDSGNPQERSALSPSNWYMASAQAAWPTNSWTQAKSTHNTSSDFTSYGGGAGLNLGLWSVGASAEHTTSHFHSDASLSKISVSYKYCIVQIRRPWMSELLFSLPGWKTDAAPKGSYSSGKRQGLSGTKFPMLPHAFIVIKDVVITGDFSDSEINQASSCSSAGAHVGWGPFSISGHYSHSKSTTAVKGDIGHGHIAQPGLQILCWINQILPFCPPQ